MGIKNLSNYRVGKVYEFKISDGNKIVGVVKNKSDRKLLLSVNNQENWYNCDQLSPAHPHTGNKARQKNLVVAEKVVEKSTKTVEQPKIVAKVQLKAQKDEVSEEISKKTEEVVKILSKKVEPVAKIEVKTQTDDAKSIDDAKKSGSNGSDTKYTTQKVVKVALNLDVSPPEEKDNKFWSYQYGLFLSELKKIFMDKGYGSVVKTYKARQIWEFIKKNLPNVNEDGGGM